MAFQNVRNNSLLYILSRDVNNLPKLEVGKVINVSLPMPKYGNTGIYNAEMVVDINLDVNGQSNNLQKLPANADIADFGNNMIVSCSKEAITSEVISTKEKSLEIVNSREFNELVINECDNIIKLLNPEKIKQEEENKLLREEINSLKEMFKEFMQTVNKAK